jgi:trehalose 6-phosphate phosphatase
MLFNHQSDALFLQVDGTLLEITPVPDSVQVPEYLIEMLYRVWDSFDGAIALISGRPVDELDRMFSPYRFASVGVHGCERRGVDGGLRAPVVAGRVINAIHDACCRFVGDSPDLLAEYKSCGAAIHFRTAPELSGHVLDFLEGLVLRVAPDFAVLRGQYACEVKPRGYSQATAMLEMLRSHPFEGRRPVYFGTSAHEDTFGAIDAAGGKTLRIGPGGHTCAQHRIANIAGVHRLLAATVARHSDAAHPEQRSSDGADSCRPPMPNPFSAFRTRHARRR